MSTEPSSSARSRVLLVDDHALFRAGLSLLVSTHPLVREVLEAGSVMEASRITVQSVHLVLLDNGMPGIRGLDGLPLLRQKFPDAAIAMVSANAGPQDIAAARQVGVDGFVPKTASAADIRLAISSLLRGQEWFPVVDDAQAMAALELASAASATPTLTGRQMLVLGYLCEGLSNRAIARRMDISENTVRSHVRGVLLYFNAISRAEAVVIAHRRGLVQ